MECGGGAGGGAWSEAAAVGVGQAGCERGGSRTWAMDAHDYKFLIGRFLFNGGQTTGVGWMSHQGVGEHTKKVSLASF